MTTVAFTLNGKATTVDADAGTPLLWIVLALWWPFALLVIRLEEMELATRFGPAYEEYRKRVPSFLPIRFRSAGEK